MGHDVFDAVDWHGEANAGVGARRRADGRVDADHLPARIQQRSTGVARVDGRIGLDDLGVAKASVLDHLGRQRAPQCTDDTDGHRSFQSEGIADGDDSLSHLECARIAQFQGHQSFGRDVHGDHCQV